MQAFLTSILSYPTVVLTTLLGIAVCYWLLVIVGALGIDALGGAEGAEGAADGHGDAGADHHVDDGGALGMLRLESAPLTVTLSVLLFFAWVLSLAGSALLGGLLEPLGAIGGGTIVLLASLVISYLLTTVAVRPLAPLFRVDRGKTRRALVGKVCVIVTGDVDDKFGQARLDDAGTEYTLRVRADLESGLKKGDEALVVDYDDEREAYVVEPIEAFIGKKRRADK